MARQLVHILLVLVSLMVATAAFAEDEKKRELVIGKWYPSLEAGLTFTQSAYSDNWAGGDRGSIVWTAILNSSLENQFSEKLNWYNTLKLAYGQTHQQNVKSDGGRVWDSPSKSTDLVDLETIFRFTMGWMVDPYASGRFESQFQDASDPFERTLSINPMRFKEAFGVAKKFIDEENRSLLTRLGFAFRQNVRRLYVGAPPDDATESEMTNDGGAEFVTDYKAKVLDNRVTWTSKLTLYQPVFYSEKDNFDSITESELMAAGIDGDLTDFTTMVDVDWENIFSSQITKVISVQMYVRWVYDKYDNSVPPKFDEDGSFINPGDVKAAIRKEGQFKQTLAIGLIYRFLGGADEG